MDKNNFERFKLKPFLMKGIEKIGFEKPTDIQERVIPKVLAGKSVVGSSQTGTGKTHAFLLPVLSMIDPEVNEVQAVITAPTRELASQIYQEAKLLLEAEGEGNPIRAKLIIGGMDKNRMVNRLKDQPHLVIGTPGRIYGLVEEQLLRIHKTRIFVVDEADLTLDMGFLETVDQMAGKMPKNLQMLVFSATIPQNLQPFLKKYMENPDFVYTDPNQTPSKNISHYLIPLKTRNKVDLLHDLLKAYNPFLAIVFANTKEKVDELADQLADKGLKTGVIHGGLSPRERKKTMKEIRSLKYQYIIATDLASRGIDIEGISHIIHYELPNDLSFYIHRAGRSGRGDYSGISTIIFEERDEDKVNKLEKMDISFQTIDLVNGEFVNIPGRSERKKRFDKKPPAEKNYIPKKKPKRIKPGYKKKMRAEQEKWRKRIGKK